MLAKTSLIAICALSASYYLWDRLEVSCFCRFGSAGRFPAASGRLRCGCLSIPRLASLSSRQLQKGTVHVYPLPLKAGEFVTVIAYQDGVDLKVTASGADGKPFLTVDSPNGSTGPERLPFVADTAATYRVEVSGASEREAGPYRIWIATERPATRNDRKNAEAEILFFQAKAKGSAAEERIAGSREPLEASRETGSVEPMPSTPWESFMMSRPDWKKSPVRVAGGQSLSITKHMPSPVRGGSTLQSALHIRIIPSTRRQRKAIQQALRHGQRGGDRRVYRCGSLQSWHVSCGDTEGLSRRWRCWNRQGRPSKVWTPSEEAKTLTAIGRYLRRCG